MVAVQCDRCGEIIRTRVDLNNDLSAEYGEGEGETAYYSRKVLIGKEGCYIPIEVKLKFDAQRNLVEKRVKGGSLRRVDFRGPRQEMALGPLVTNFDGMMPQKRGSAQ